MMVVKQTGPRESAFDAIFGAHHQSVYLYLIRRGVSQHDAEDLTAEVFATAWRKRTQLPPHPLPWLYRVAGNHLLHHQRSHQRRQRLTHSLAAAAKTVPLTPAFNDDSSSDHVTAAIETLSAADQEVLRLAAWEHLTTSELADVLRCSESAARVRLHRARKRLAAALDSSRNTPTRVSHPQPIGLTP